MGDKEGMGAVADRDVEDLARVGGDVGEGASRHLFEVDELPLAIAQGDVERLYRMVEVGQKVARSRLGRVERGQGRRVGEAGGEGKCRFEPQRFDRADADNLGQFYDGRLRKRLQTGEMAEQLCCELQDGLRCCAGVEEEGQELRRGEGLCAEPDESLARSLFDRQVFHSKNGCTLRSSSRGISISRRISFPSYSVLITRPSFISSEARA